MRVNLTLDQDIRLAADAKIARLNQEKRARELNLSRQIEDLLREWVRQDDEHQERARA